MKSFAKTMVAATLGSVVTMLFFYFFLREPQVVIQQASDSLIKSTSLPSEGNEVYIDFSNTAEKVTPAVVHIKATSLRAAEPQNNIPPMFRDFFGDSFRFEREPQPRVGSGSGVIISSDGYIVTNNHVIANADQLEVTLFDKRSYKAKIIGTDPSTDLALIQIQESNLPSLRFGNSEALKVGQWVLAVGNPFNLESTVTAGIVSAKGRSINILGGGSSIESFIQTDAAVNPGNSGGALVNVQGDLVGINTAIASPTGSYSGYSFAVPSSITKKVVEDLITYGKVQRAFLGIEIRSVDGKMAQEKNLNVTEGVYVQNISKGGSADLSGIKEGDVILQVDKKPIRSVPELQEMIGKKRPGEVVEVMINRNGKTITKNITLKNQSGNTELVRNDFEMLKELGIELEPVSKSEAQKMGVSAGLKVTKLYAGKLRGKTGMKEGFIITKVNRQPVKTVEEFVQILQAENGGVLVEGVYPDSKEVFYYGFGM
jgi:Do/DeqQ family serine protease